jgi:hypothetical protein
MQFGDLNEFNFILDQNNNVKAIDLDSAYVGQDEMPNQAYYLEKTPVLHYMNHKYKKTKQGFYIPDNNSDLYCYNMMAIDAIAKEDVFKYDISIYYMYLNHLKDAGLSKDLIKSFEKVFLPQDNDNIKDLLGDVDCSMEEDFTFKTFKKEYKNELKNTKIH